MKPQAKLGDTSTHGGTIVSGSKTAQINGKPAARLGDLHDCPKHGMTPIVSASSTILIDGRPSARLGNITACGAVLVTGSPNTGDG